MKPEHRHDGLLAMAALATLFGLAAVDGSLGAVVRPGAAAIGVVGALALEAVLLRNPELSRELWERPVVQIVAFALLAAVGIVAIRSGLGWVLAALAWGLLAYLSLLGLVVTGVGNPVARLVGR